MKWFLPCAALVVVLRTDSQDVPSAPAPADLVVTNARVIVGTGVVLAKGSIVIREGRIEAVVEGESAPPAKRVVDAEGRTALPGLIDTHRHFLPHARTTNETQLASYIEDELPPILAGLLTAGITTVMSPGDFAPEIYDVRRRLREGELVGPRLITTGPVFTAPGGHPAGGPICRGEPFCRGRVAVEVDDPELARQRVREVVEMGADAIKVAIDRVLVPDAVIDDAVVAAIADEAHTLGVPLIVHAESSVDMLKAVQLGADRLAHTPKVGRVEDTGAAAILLERGVPIATTVAFSTRAAARGGGWPWNEGEYDLLLSNIRHLVDAGVIVAFGTDNPPWLGLTEFMYEVEALGSVLSAQEVLDSMTIQAARFLAIDDRVGTLEPGKVADLILVEGDPLEDLSALAKVAVVVQRGVLVVDGR